MKSLASLILLTMLSLALWRPQGPRSLQPNSPDTQQKLCQYLVHEESLSMHCLGGQETEGLQIVLTKKGSRCPTLSNVPHISDTLPLMASVVVLTARLISPGTTRQWLQRVEPSDCREPMVCIILSPFLMDAAKCSLVYF